LKSLIEVSMVGAVKGSKGGFALDGLPQIAQPHASNETYSKTDQYS